MDKADIPAMVRAVAMAAQLAKANEASKVAAKAAAEQRAKQVSDKARASKGGSTYDHSNSRETPKLGSNGRTAHAQDQATRDKAVQAAQRHAEQAQAVQNQAAQNKDAQDKARSSGSDDRGKAPSNQRPDAAKQDGAKPKDHKAEGDQHAASIDQHDKDPQKLTAPAAADKDQGMAGRDKAAHDAGKFAQDNAARFTKDATPATVPASAKDDGAEVTEAAKKERSEQQPSDRPTRPDDRGGYDHANLRELPKLALSEQAGKRDSASASEPSWMTDVKQKLDLNGITWPDNPRAEGSTSGGDQKTVLAADQSAGTTKLSDKVHSLDKPTQDDKAKFPQQDTEQVVGQRVSLGELAEAAAKARFADADWTNKNQKAVDYTRGAKPDYSKVMMDKEGVAHIDEKRTGGEWGSVKTLRETDGPDRVPKDAESKVRLNANVAMEKYVDVLDHPDAPRNAAKWQKYDDGTMWRLDLRDPEAIRVVIQVPGLTPGAQAALQTTAQEQVALHKANVRPGVEVLVDVVRAPPETVPIRGTIQVGPIKGSADAEKPAADGQAEKPAAKGQAEKPAADGQAVEFPHYDARVAESWAIEFNHAVARAADMATGNAAYEAFKARMPEVERLRNEGKWVVVSAVFSEPRFPSLSLVMDPRDLRAFVDVKVRSGDSKESAIHPPSAWELPSPTGKPFWGRDPLPLNRKYRIIDTVFRPHSKE
jgi:hypothetical protein